MARRKGQVVNGILLLDKPIGLTSNEALTEVKKLFHPQKAGHTGSLDPLACGMLPICFGEATKFSQFLLDADKQYLVEAKLGIRTTTGDAEGEVVAQKAVAIDENQLLQALQLFTGEISQIPSMYSALKYQGKPLYFYARQGIEIERPSRQVHIKKLELLKTTPDTFTVMVTCTKGTYIRTLIEDIGEHLGCGAHVSFLKRTYVSPYHNCEMIALETLQETDNKSAFLLPIDSALSEYPGLKIAESLAYYMKKGQPVLVPKAPTEGLVRLYEDDFFIGVGEILDDGKVAPRRLVAGS